MHEPYDGYEEEYNDDDYDHDYSKDPYKWYYKFDIGPDTPVSNWLVDVINKWWGDINNPKFPVNSWNPSTDKGNSLQYLGSNYQGSPIWKKQYFAIDKINNEYKLHLQAHARHFVSQPLYYNGLFDILN